MGGSSGVQYWRSARHALRSTRRCPRGASVRPVHTCDGSVQMARPVSNPAAPRFPPTRRASAQAAGCARVRHRVRALPRRRRGGRRVPAGAPPGVRAGQAAPAPVPAAPALSAAGRSDSLRQGGSTGGVQGAARAAIPASARQPAACRSGAAPGAACPPSRRIPAALAVSSDFRRDGACWAAGPGRAARAPLPRGHVRDAARRRPEPLARRRPAGAPLGLAQRVAAPAPVLRRARARRLGRAPQLQGALCPTPQAVARWPPRPSDDAQKPARLLGWSCTPVCRLAAAVLGAGLCSAAQYACD